jgi:O-methyltransferase
VYLCTPEQAANAKLVMEWIKELTVFQVVNYSLILVFVILLIRYLWIVYAGGDRQPVQWMQAIAAGEVSKEVKRMKRAYTDKVRFFNWWFQVARLNREHVPGAFVELGVYKGDSARILHRLDPSRPFHLFDTFTGFTAGDLSVETGEAATYTPDHFRDTSVEGVLQRIGGNGNIFIHAGYFPETAANFHEKVALVNIDADLYNPTRAALAFFYPLLSPGGVIMVHDYNAKWPGVVKAVDDFLATVPENPALLPDINGTVMIIRNK